MRIIQTSFAALFLYISSLVAAPAQGFANSDIPFTQNQGQWGEKTIFKTMAGGVIYYFCRDEVACVFARNTDLLDNHSFPSKSNLMDNGDALLYKQEAIMVNIRFIQSNSESEIRGEDRLLYNYNYFYGQDPLRWRTDVPNWSAIVYKEIWPGIDIRYRGNGNSLIYDFIVQPGADISQIHIQYDGISALEITDDGRLEITTPFGKIYEDTPDLYQDIDGEISAVSGAYQKKGNDSFGFVINRPYDPLETLIIDPALLYSTYLGSLYNDYGYSIAVDRKGNACVTGSTRSPEFPNRYPYDGDLGGYGDAFVTKFTASGDQLMFSTFIGGSSLDDGESIAVDSAGYIYIGGITCSDDFPIANAYDSIGGITTDAFLLKLSPTGNNLYYSTFLGGSNADGAWAITLDNHSCIYAVGWTFSQDFPLMFPFDDSVSFNRRDGFISKLSSQGDSLLYSSYIGGDSTDNANSIAADDIGNVYVVGWTESPDFPTLNAYDRALNGTCDAYVAKISTIGDSLAFCTYLGGNRVDVGIGIGVDGAGIIYVSGWTSSSNFPLASPDDNSLSGEKDAFITEFSNDGSGLIFSSYLGGRATDVSLDISVSRNGDAYLTGWTASSDFPTINGYDETWNHGGDVFVTRFSSQQRTPSYSTFVGGSNYEQGNIIAFDDLGYMYVTGYTYSHDFPTVNPYDSTYNDSINGSGDAIVLKLEPPEMTNINTPIQQPISILSFSYPNPFNSTCYINFTLPEQAHVAIDIYNILGQKVATPLNDLQAAGEHSVVFDAKNLGSGLYFYRLNAGEYSETKSIVLIK